MKGRRRQTFQRLAIVLTVISCVIGGTIWSQSPRTMRIAVGPGGSAQHTFVIGIAAALRQGHLPFRFRIVTTSGTQASAGLLDRGEVDLAVLRSDDLTSAEARSVVVIQKRSLLLISPHSKAIADFAAAVGKKISLLQFGGDSNLPLLQRILEHYGPKASAITIKPMDLAQLEAGMVDGSIDGFVTVSYPGTREMRGLLADLAEKSKTNFSIVGMPGSEALSFRFRELESSKVPAGMFSGSPSLPEENVSTVAITYEITATRQLPELTVANLAKALMDIRSKLRGARENNFQIETPGLEEERRYLPHLGTSAYVNDTAKTFLETYSDEIWLALFTLSLVGTSITGFLGWIGVRKKGDVADFSLALPSLIDKIESAGTTAEIDAVQREFENVLKDMLRAHAEGENFTDAQKQTQLIIPVVRELIQSRRAELVRT